MINLDSTAAAYVEETIRAAERARTVLYKYAAHRGYVPFDQDNAAASCYGGNAHISFHLKATDDPQYWFDVDCYATQLRHFSSRSSSHRGNIRVTLPEFGKFLDEMDIRKREWIKLGRKIGGK